MFFKNFRGMSAIIMLLGILSVSAHAQFVLSSTQARIGETFTMSVTGATPNSEYIILVDRDPGPTFFPSANNLQVDLGFSVNFLAFPSTFADSNGDGSLNLISNEPGAIGGTFFCQALAVDPIAPFGISVSNQTRGTIHPQVPTSAGSRTNLNLADDSSALVPLGFSFPFYGQTYTEAYVNSNGTLTFGQANTSFTITESFFLSGAPTIAGLWTDLNPQLGGAVEWDATSTPGQTITFHWTNVNDNLQGGPNTFSISLDLNGHIITDYGACTVSEGIVGMTPGMSAAPMGINLSSIGWSNHGLTESVYEDFTGGAFDLSNSYSLYANTFNGESIYFH